MSARWEGQSHSLVRDLQVIFSTRLVSIVLYGENLDERAPAPIRSLVLVSKLTQEDLNACARFDSQWKRDGIDTPLLLPVNEFTRSLDAFPLEYADILAKHVPVFGADPFDGVTIAAEDIRRACEKQVASHLLHLREGYLETGGHPLAIAQLVAASAPSLSAILRNLARLTGGRGDTHIEVAMAGARALGVSDQVVSQVLSLHGAETPSADGARLFEPYLASVERLANAVDAWQP